jgi:hypothetical protein
VSVLSIIGYVVIGLGVLLVVLGAIVSMILALKGEPGKRTIEVKPQAGVSSEVLTKLLEAVAKVLEGLAKVLDGVANVIKALQPFAPGMQLVLIGVGVIVIGGAFAIAGAFI